MLNLLKKTSINLLILFFYSCNFSSKPNLKLLPHTYDFGEIKKDSLYEGYVVIKNTGRSLLVIENTSPDCGCTKVLLSKSELKPKDTCLLTFSYNTFNKKGQQENYILLTANTDSLVHALQINAFVK